MALQIGIRRFDDVAIVDLAGRLWVQEPGLREQVHSLLDEGCRFLILNLQDVDYMDSSGLGQMVSIWTSARSRNGNIVLLRPTERVKRLLRTTALHIVFDVFDDEERARTAVRRDWPR
jgi:anti-sigma B factor antagonist